MKSCTKCHIPKPDDEFYKDSRTKDKLSFACKVCIDACKTRYNHTVDGLITSIYSRQKAHSKRRGHPLPTYTKQKLKAWILNNKEFETLFDDWKNSGFNKDLRPSIDRLKDQIGYGFDNIRLTTWEQNYQKKPRSHTRKAFNTCIPKRY